VAHNGRAVPTLLSAAFSVATVRGFVEIGELNNVYESDRSEMLG